MFKDIFSMVHKIKKFTIFKVNVSVAPMESFFLSRTCSSNGFEKLASIKQNSILAFTKYQETLKY